MRPFASNANADRPWNIDRPSAFLLPGTTLFKLGQSHFEPLSYTFSHFTEKAVTGQGKRRFFQLRQGLR
jgi:hypothetical protein